MRVRGRRRTLAVKTPEDSQTAREVVEPRGHAVLPYDRHHANWTGWEASLSDEPPLHENRRADPQAAEQREHVGPSAGHAEVYLGLSYRGQEHADLHRQVEELGQLRPDRDLAPSQVGRFQDGPPYGVHH